MKKKESKEEEKKKSAKELKQEFIESRREELVQIEIGLLSYCEEHSIDLGSRTITEEGGRSRNEIFIIDKL